MDMKFCAGCGTGLKSYTVRDNRLETANCGSRNCRFAEVPVFHVLTGKLLSQEEREWHATTQALRRAFVDRSPYPERGSDVRDQLLASLKEVRTIAQMRVGNPFDQGWFQRMDAAIQRAEGGDAGGHPGH